MTMVCTGSICLEELKRLVCKHFTIEEEDNESPIDLANNMQSCIESFQCRFSGERKLDYYNNTASVQIII